MNDVQKAEYMYTGAKHGKRRRFYGVDEGDPEAIRDVVQGSLNDYIRTEG